MIFFCFTHESSVRNGTDSGTPLYVLIGDQSNNIVRTSGHDHDSRSIYWARVKGTSTPR